MKLYRVTVEHTFFMTAEDGLSVLEAESWARKAVREDIDLDLITDTQVTTLDEVPKEYRDTYPYGKGGNERTIKEWLIG